MNSNSVFLHLLRFFLLGCEKAACTHARYARIDSNRSKRKYFTLELRSIDRYGAIGAIYRKRDQHRHLSTENTCRPENLPCKSVVLENETKKKKEKREKQERKEREKERGGRERKREKKNLSERTLTIVKLARLARFELIAARNDTFFYLWALLPPCGPSRGLKSRKRTFIERYLAPVERRKNTDDKEREREITGGDKGAKKRGPKWKKSERNLKPSSLLVFSNFSSRARAETVTIHPTSCSSSCFSRFPG